MNILIRPPYDIKPFELNRTIYWNIHISSDIKHWKICSLHSEIPVIAFWSQKKQQKELHMQYSNHWKYDHYNVLMQMTSKVFYREIE